MRIIETDTSPPSESELQYCLMALLLQAGGQIHVTKDTIQDLHAKAADLQRRGGTHVGISCTPEPDGNGYTLALLT